MEYTRKSDRFSSFSIHILQSCFMLRTEVAVVFELNIFFQLLTHTAYAFDSCIQDNPFRQVYY